MQQHILVNDLSGSNTLPYSFSHGIETVSPGSLPCFLTGTNPTPSFIAIPGPNRKPRASRPMTGHNELSFLKVKFNNKCKIFFNFKSNLTYKYWWHTTMLLMYFTSSFIRIMLTIIKTAYYNKPTNNQLDIWVCVFNVTGQEINSSWESFRMF